VSSSALAGLERWPVPTVAAAVVTADGSVVETHGPQRHRFRLASIAKLLTAYAVMVGVEEEAISLDDVVDGPAVIAALQPTAPEGRRLAAVPAGTTVRHLLSHTSGLGFNGPDPALSKPGERRTYSNAGIEVVAEHLTQATGVPFEEYLTEAVLEPLGMGDTLLDGSPAHGVYSTAADLVAFVRELFEPHLLDPATLARMIAVAYPGVDGVVPGVGSFRPCDWGLGFERNFGRTGHWAGTTPSRETFGHFGGAGTMLWVDPRAGVATVCLTDRPFDAWALQVWPPMSTAVIQAHAQPHGRV
jgi:CubicO group peptidase (beta-lactamase class C family)